MIVNKSSMYSPKKATPKPVAPPRPNINQNNNQMLRSNVNVPMERRQNPSLRPMVNQQRPPRQVVKPDQVIPGNINEIDFFENMMSPLDMFFGDGFLKEMFNEKSLKELAKTNDVNHEKWTRVDKDTNSVVHFESFSITSKTPNKKHK